MEAKSEARVWTQPKMAALLILGISSGMPLNLINKDLQAWMTVENVSLATVGAVSLLSLPYSFKWLWAPLLDRYVPPFFGRRRGWIVIAQALLMVATFWMSLHDPQRALFIIFVNAVVIAFLSATQDVVLDAYRTDVLSDREMGAGAALFTLGYRIALLITAGFAFMLADKLSWPTVYVLMAALFIPLMITTWRSPEPRLQVPAPKSLGEAVVKPFQDFFTRAGAMRAVIVLIFIVIYKLPEYLAQNMATPFLLKLGFSQAEIGATQGVIGLIAVIVGALAGGAAVAKIGINKSLWSFAILGAASNLMFYLLAHAGQNHTLLVLAVIVENFCLGLVNGVFVAFLMSMCNVQFSATQYALLSSLMGASRDILVSPAGKIAEITGFATFFLLALAMVIPGLLLLPFIAPWGRQVPTMAAVHTGETVPASKASTAAVKTGEKK